LVLPRRVKVIMTKGGREQLLVLAARVMVTMMKVDRKHMLVLPRRVRVIMTKGGREQLLVLAARVMVIMMKVDRKKGISIPLAAVGPTC
jgi:hypothetical protein